MKPDIGLQLYSVRNNLGQDYAKTLEKIAGIGYREIELITTLTPDGLVFGKAMRAPELRHLLDRLGLRAVSSHFVPSQEMNLEKIIDDLHVLGVDSLVCAIAFFANETEVAEFTTTFNRYAEQCKKAGIQLYYHNHFHEFQVFGSKSVFERMMEGLDEELVMFEFDTYWAVRGGQDPIYWLKKLGKRCDLLHLKDLPESAFPVNLFEKLGYDAQFSFGSTWGPLTVDHFTEIGEGTLDLAGMIEASRRYNQPRCIIVEQDMTRKTELESIAVSFANLNRLLEEN